MKTMEPDLETIIVDVARRARAASRAVRGLSAPARHAALLGMADGLEASAQAILDANALDLAAAQEAGLSAAMLDRLRLDEARVSGLAAAVRDVARLPDPVGEVAEAHTRPNGLRVERVRIPLGVVAMIYEARPNVTSDAAALCFKAGNAVILRGGREAFHSNRAIGEALRSALQAAGVTPDAVQLVPTTDRAGIDVLVRQDAFIDVVIPRGGEGLIRAVVEKSRVPVLKHYRGVCHVYVDRAADLEKAAAIVVNAKAQRPGVCNAAETLLLHGDVAPAALAAILPPLAAAGVELRACERTRSIVDALPEDVLPADARCALRIKPATTEDWAAEYLDLILAVRVVDSLDDAVDHICAWGSDHTEAIVTEDAAAADAFVAGVSSSTVVVNASTRFADGGELGLGAEIGISTSRLHAYGPMGARELTTLRFVVRGEGQTR